MTKEEAIRILASSCIPGSKQTEALETLIPELAESEDERIRKAIIHYILYETKGTINEATEHTWVKWLEKQKEQSITANDLDEEIKRFFDDCIDVHEAKLYGNISEKVIPVDCYELTARHFAKWGEKQKEQKPSINIDQLKSLMLQYLQEAANEKDDLDIEADTDKWARKILGYDFEQKPVDLSEMMVHKEPYIAPVPTPMVADEQKHILKFKVGDKVHLEGDDVNILTITGIEKDRYLTDNSYGPILFGAEDIWERVEQKPAVWSKEDENMRESAIALIRKWTNYSGENVGDSIKVISWLQWLPFLAHQH